MQKSLSRVSGTMVDVVNGDAQNGGLAALLRGYDEGDEVAKRTFFYLVVKTIVFLSLAFSLRILSRNRLLRCFCSLPPVRPLLLLVFHLLLLLLLLTTKALEIIGLQASTR